MSEHWIVNSDITKRAFFAHVDKLYDEFKYLTFAWRIGPDRSLDQNALFHVWLTEYIAFKLGIDKKQVTKAEVAGIKRTLKKLFYIETSYSWMIHTITDYSTGRTKKDFTSSADWGRGEMFEFLAWMQMLAANDGCVLEAKGQFKKLQAEQNKV